MLNSVVKLHNRQPLKLYKSGSNSSLETIRPGVKPSSKSVTTIGNWAQANPAVQAGNGQPHRTITNRYCGPTGPTEDQQGPPISYRRTTGPRRDPIGPPKGQVPDHRKVRSDQLQKLSDHRNKNFLKYVSVILYQVQHRNSSTFYVSE